MTASIACCRCVPGRFERLLALAGILAFLLVLRRTGR